jgi:hypothetical protein
LADDAQEGWFYLKRLFFSYRLRRAAFEGFAAEGDLLRRFRLAEDVALADFVTAVEKDGSVTSAEIAVDAGGIDVEASGGVLREAVKDVGHQVNWVG